MKTPFILVLLTALGCGQPASQPVGVRGVSVQPPIPEEKPAAGAPDRAKSTRPGTDWPRFLGPNSDCSSPETGIRTDWTGGLKKIWECPLGAGYAPPAVTDGKLVHFDRVGDQARVVCRNAETGEFIWKFEYPTAYVDMYGYDPGARCSPVIDHG